MVFWIESALQSTPPAELWKQRLLGTSSKLIDMKVISNSSTMGICLTVETGWAQELVCSGLSACTHSGFVSPRVQR